MTGIDGDRSPRVHVAVLGLVAAGKSTLATALEERLGLPHVDSDEQLAALTGEDGATIAERDGVAALHDLEEAVLLGALSMAAPSIVSAAASTIESIRCRTALARRATVVWIDITTEEALARTRDDDHRRPIDRDEFSELRTRRAPLFEEVADVRLDATTDTAAQVERVLATIQQRPSAL